jgi:hypothetical protein
MGITPAAGYDPNSGGIPPGMAWWGTHQLANQQAVSSTPITSNPNTSVDRGEAVANASNYAFAADLVVHTQALTNMRDSNQQNTHILAAHVLSPSSSSYARG